LNDPYVRAAKIDGYRSRAAYKLIEIDDKHQAAQARPAVVDLGAAPGGWCQVARSRPGQVDRSRTRASSASTISTVEPLPGVTLLLKDFLDDDAPEALRAALGGHAPNLVMSDMAAPTTGHRQTDHLRTTHLFEVAEEFARENLAPGGAFLSKVFRGGAENEALARLKRDYQSVHHIKPPASRKESPELYVLAKGFRGGEG
jgi:23S rRNA (uridine2552-2'-O)-methyltransferase